MSASGSGVLDFFHVKDPKEKHFLLFKSSVNYVGKISESPKNELHVHLNSLKFE